MMRILHFIPSIDRSSGGVGAYMQLLAKEFGKLGDLTIATAASVDFCGGVYGDRKWELFREADLFVLPTYSENFGIVVAEALACGIPVITTTGTPWEELNTWHCGWWTEIGTEPTIHALNEFLDLSEKELEQMGRNGRRLVETQYSSKKVAEEMVRMYESLTLGPSPKERGVPCGGMMV